MNKKSIRLLTLLLAFCMLVPMLFACGGGEEEEESSEGGIVIPDDDPLKSYEELDFGNKQITISLSQFIGAEIPDRSEHYIKGPDRTGKNNVQNEIYERNRRVQRTVQVKPYYVYTNLDYSEIASDIQTHVLTPTAKSPDLYIDQVWGLLRAQMAGHLYNAYGEGKTSHIDFGDKTEKTDKGWYNDYMKAFNFASDTKCYILAGDYFMDIIRMLNLVGCNTTLFDQRLVKIGGKDALYDAVENGEWTVDKMIEWSEAAALDSNNNGKADANDTVIGTAVLSGGASAMGILPACGVSMFKIEDGGKTVKAEPDSRAFNVIGKWIDSFKNKGVFIMKTPQSGGTYNMENLRNFFTSGKTLFATGIQLNAMETETFQNMEDYKCVLPFPKYESGDDYIVTTHDNARGGSILKCSSKFEAVTAWLQAMSVSSTEILNEYYNGALKFKESNDYGSARMMDIIYENISAPYYMLDSAVINIQSLPIGLEDWPTRYSIITDATTNEYTSKYQGVQGPLGIGLRDYRAKFDALKDQ